MSKWACPACGHLTDAPNTIAARLGHAIAMKGISVRDLSRGLSGLGRSYANLRRFLAGLGEPNPSLLLEMAEILDVRVEWLAFGSGDVR